MRFFGLVLLLALPVVTSCSSVDQAPVYMDVDYQVRCEDCQDHANDGDAHAIKAFDGDSGYSLQCAASVIRGKHELSFSALLDADNPANSHELKISQVRLDTKDPGADCSVSINDSGNTYGGACTAGTPTTDAPCQVKLDVSGSIVKGTVYCSNVPNIRNNTSVRYLVAPETASEPVAFEIHNCSGL